MKRFFWIFALLFICLLPLSNPVSAQNSTHVVLLVRDFHRNQIRKEPLTITAESSGQTWETKTDGAGVAQLDLPPGDKYFVGIGNQPKYDFFRLGPKPGKAIRHTVLYNGPTRKKPKKGNTMPAMADMPSLRDSKVNIKLTFISPSGIPCAGELVTLAGHDNTYQDSTDEKGRVWFEVEDGDEYTIQLAFNENFDVLKIKNHAQGMIVEGTYGYLGSAAIKANMEARKAEAERMMASGDRDSAGFLTKFKPGNVKSLPVQDLREQMENGFVLNLDRPSRLTTPAWMNGNLYMAGGFSSDKLYCFDAKTGKMKWASDVSDRGAGSVVCRENTVVANYESCTLFALDGNTGEMKWSWWLGDPLLSSPAVDNGRVFTCYPDPFPKLRNPKDPNTHALVAFDLETGEIQWQTWINGDIISAPVAQFGELVFSTYSGMVYRVAQENGSILAQNSLPVTSAPTPAGGNYWITERSMTGNGVQERVVMLDSKGLLPVRDFDWVNAPWLDKKVQKASELAKNSWSLDASNGWGAGPFAQNGFSVPGDVVGTNSVSALQAFTGSRVLEYEGLTWQTLGDQVVCQEVESGREKWRFKLKGNLKKQGGHLGTAPMLTDGKVVVATLEGEILFFDAQKGKVLESLSFETSFRSQPIVMEGWIYCPTTDGKLVAVNLKDPSMTGWRALGGNPQHTNQNEAMERSR